MLIFFINKHWKVNFIYLYIINTIFSSVVTTMPNFTNDSLKPSNIMRL